MNTINTQSFKNPDKNHTKPFFRYGGFSICLSPTDKYPHMVEISRGPKHASKIVGKKYLTQEFAIKAIDEYKADRMITNQLSNAITALEAEGFEVEYTLESIDEN